MGRPASGSARSGGPKKFPSRKRGDVGSRHVISSINGSTARIVRSAAVSMIDIRLERQ
jgi:hypothetical protein